MRTLTQVLEMQELADLDGFGERSESLALWTRRPPDPLPAIPILAFQAVAEVGELDQLQLPAPIRRDVVALAGAFARGFGLDRVEVTLDVARPCRRYHADSVIARLLCTYVGPGTLWLPDGSFDRVAAEARGTTNEDILPDPRRARQMGLWEVGVLKGKLGSSRPIYHRSPDDAGVSLILKVDLAP